MGSSAVRFKVATQNFMRRRRNDEQLYYCTNCGIPTRKGGPFCDVCQTMPEVVERPFFMKAQQEFDEENMRRFRTKERLLHDSEESELR